jgi:hypothetical protein
MLRRTLEIATGVGWTIATLTLGLLLSSLFRSTNFTVHLATVAFCALAIARPSDALLAAAAFVGFGDILGHLSGVPTLRAEDAIVVATLFGWSLRALVARDSGRPLLRHLNSVPVALFGLTALCSAVVWMRLDQARTAYLSTYLADVWHAVSSEYFVRMDRFLEVASTVALLESLALYLAAASMCQADRTFFSRAVRMLIAGGAGLGVLSIVRIVEITMRNPNAIAMIRAAYGGVRISPQIPDYIAAASYFALCWTAAVGAALQRSRLRVFMVIAALASMAGLFLTGSRSGVGAAGVGIFVLAYLVARRRVRIQSLSPIGFGAIALAVFAVMFRQLIGHDLTGVTAGESLKVRIELVKAGAGVLGKHPLFGVGLDRFFLYLDRFASPQLKAAWYGRLNPHNDFLRIATEFGLVGLSLFLWTLVGSVRRIWHSVSNRVDAPVAGLVGGLAAFVITMFISNPLMVHPVSYAFWIALGLATGEAAATESAGTRSDDVAQPPWSRNALIALCACVIVASVPIRAAHEIAAVDLAGVTYGLYDWTASPDGSPSRLSGAQATVFVSADARAVEFPLTGTLPSGGSQTVQVLVDGRPADQLSVGQEPKRLRLVLPNRTGRARRIDFHVSPSWSPADVDASSDDHRRFGVRIGEVAVARDAAAIR